MNDNLSSLYNGLRKKGYSTEDIGDESTFRERMKDKNNRKQLYDYVSARKDFKIGDYDSYEQRLSGESQNIEPVNNTPETNTMISELKTGIKNLKTPQLTLRDIVSENNNKNIQTKPKIEDLTARNDATSVYKPEIKLPISRDVGQEEKELDNTFKPQAAQKPDDVLQNYQERFALTARGKELNAELGDIQQEIAEKYANEFLDSDAYKELQSKYTGEQLDVEANKLFENAYQDKIQEDMRPYYDAYQGELYNRYQSRIEDEIKNLTKEQVAGDVDRLTQSVNMQMEDVNKKLTSRSGQGGNALNAIMGSANYNIASASERKQKGELEAAQNLLAESQNIIDEARKKGSTNFFAGLARGFADKAFDPENWAFGLSELRDSKALMDVLDKYDKGEELNASEQALMDAAVANMATNAYYYSDLGRGYKAGMTTGQSIPFMLEFAINPVSASGSSIAKSILRYGMKKFGKEVAKKGVSKFAARLAGDALAAAGMSSTTGAARVAGGAIERQTGDIQLDDTGRGYGGRTGQQTGGEALAKSTMSTFLENQSEMVFNAFKGFGPAVWANVEKAVPGGVSAVMDNALLGKAGEIYRKIKSNPTLVEAARRTQFHGLAEEYLEEVYNNFANIPLGEMTLEEATDLDNNIDTFLGLAPTSAAFGLLGIGGYAREQYRHRRKMQEAFGQMTRIEREKLSKLEEMSAQKGNEDIKRFIKETIASTELTPEEKKAEIAYAYDIAVNNAMQDISNEQEKEIADNNNAAIMDGQAIYAEHDPVKMRQTVLRREIARERLAAAGMSENDINTLTLGNLNAQSRNEFLQMYDENIRNAATDYLNALDRETALNDALDDAHEGEVTEARRRANDITLPNGTVTVVPLGRYATDTAQLGVVVNGIDANGAPTQTNGALMVYPIQADQAGEPLFSTIDYDNALTMVPESYTDAMVFSPTEAFEGMLSDYSADVAILTGTQIAPQAQFDIMMDDGSIQPVTVMGNNGAGAWIVSTPEGQVLNPIAEEELATRKRNAEIAPIMQEYDAAAQIEQQAKEEVMKTEYPEEVRALQPQPSDDIVVNGRKAKIKEVAPDGLIIDYINDEGDIIGTDQVPVEAFYQYKQSLNEAAAQQAQTQETETEANKTPETKKKDEQPLEFVQDYPRDKNGEPMFSEMSAADTISLLQATLEDDAASYAADKLEEAKKNAEKAAKKSAKKTSFVERAKEIKAIKEERDNAAKELAYWQDIYNCMMPQQEAPQQSQPEAAVAQTEAEQQTNESQQRQTSTSTEEPAAPQAAVQQRTYNKPVYRKKSRYVQDDMALGEANSPQEFILREIATGRVAFIWKDTTGGKGLGSHLGVKESEEERRRLIWALNSEEGMIPEVASEAIYEDMPEGLQQQLTQQDVFNYLIEAFSMYGTPRKMFDAAKQMHGVSNQEEIEGYEEDMERQYMEWEAEQNNMTVEDWIAYNEIIAEELEKFAASFTDEELNTIFEQIYEQLEQEENERRRIEEESAGSTEKPTDNERGDNVLPEQETDTERRVEEQPGAQQETGTDAQGAGMVSEQNGIEAETEQEKGYSIVPAQYTTKRGKVLDMQLVTFDRELSKDELTAARTLARELKGWYDRDQRGFMMRSEEDAIALVNDVIGQQPSTVSKQIEQARAEVDTNPTEAQKEAGNYKKGHIKLDGYDVTIENPKGSERKGVDASGKAWSVTMNNDYGYIRGTKGVDGDHIDVFLSDNPESGNVYVVDQVNSDGTFDEHKVMYGFSSEEEARKAYLANYSPGWTGLGNITEVSKDDFKKWVESSHRKTKAFAEYASIKKKETEQSPNLLPKNLREAYESEDKEKIAGAEKELLNYIENSEDLEMLYSTYLHSKNLLKNKGVLTDSGAKMHAFIAKACKDALVKKSIPSPVFSNEKSKIKFAESTDNLSALQLLSNDSSYDVVRAIIKNPHAGENLLNNIKERFKNNGLDWEAEQELDKRKNENKGEKRESNSKSVTESNEIEKIEDVGEKIGGAKKDLVKDYARKIKDIEEDNSSILSDIAKLPLSRIYNFDYAALRKEGVSNETISFLETIKKIIPSKPRTEYKLKRWTENVFTLYNMALHLVSSEGTISSEWMQKALNIQGIKEKYDAYMALGGFDAGIDTGNAGLMQLGKDAGHYDNEGKWISSEGKWYVNYAGSYSGIYDTKEKAIDALKTFSSTLSTKEEKKTVFSVYTSRKDGKSFITVKGKPSVIIQNGFDTAKDAFAYIKDNYNELVSKYARIKEKTEVSFSENRERTGKDWRAGKNINADEFMKSFGFRGVEFGNWTNQKDRQEALNKAYDALMDLAEAIGKNPYSLSLNGELGIAFGARGGGRASAHYEANKVVINLTKTQGAGSLAHEWWHALDNYFARQRGEKLGFNTERKGYKYNREKKDFTSNLERQEITDAFKKLMSDINKSDYGKRSSMYAELKSNYWKSPTELGARAFASWVERKLSEKGIINDYLSNTPIPKGFEDYVDRYYPYPIESDFEILDESFDNLFNAIQEKVDDETGNVILFNIAPVSVLPMNEEQQTAFNTVMEMLNNAGVPVEVLTNEQMNELLRMQNAQINTPRLMTVYHGSGAAFDRFDHSHMGEGEGAQAYGWGSYVTEVENIGKTYADSTSGNLFRSGFGDFYLREIRKGLAEGKRFDDIKQNLLAHHAEMYEKAGGNTDMYSDFISDYETLRQLKESNLPKRNLYTVEIPDNTGENYLDWTSKVGKKIVENLKEALSNAGWVIEESINGLPTLTRNNAKIVLNENASGADLYTELSEAFGSQEAASKFLSSIGYTGISYPAQYTTGGRADGARNYVIFNENDLQIKTKISFMKGKKESPETASVLQEEHQPTVVSSDNGAKILNNLDNLLKKYQEKSNQSKTFLGDVSNVIGARKYGSSSQYATFETINGKIITIRLANHNASTVKFDNAKKNNGISIVISSKKNEGITNDGNAHITEYYYDAIKLRKSDGKPLADIVRSIKQALYSGEYTDATGIAQVQEVNAYQSEEIRNGIVYGATVGEKIYLNGSALNPETPIHEYTHIWDDACRKNNPELWNRGVELMKQTPVWDEVKNDPNYSDLQTDDEIASEVHSRLTGKDGAAILEQMAKESRKNGKMSNDEAATLREKLKQWLNDFWYWLKDTMLPWSKEEASKVSLNDFINMPLKDLATGAKLNRDNVKSEEKAIIENAIANGTYMKAPNGKPSNLNNRQWVQVRTKAFKEWFGDWENNPENASKVVDENGEPMVVYHGTFNEFNTFEKNRLGENTDFNASDENFAKTAHIGFWFNDKKIDFYKYHKAAFLNMKEPLEYSSLASLSEDLSNYNQAETFVEDISSSYDSIILLNDEEFGSKSYVAFYPNQIKSATENTGTFNAGTDDIRYREEDIPKKLRDEIYNALKEGNLYLTDNNVNMELYGMSGKYMKMMPDAKDMGVLRDGQINVEKAKAIYKMMKGILTDMRKEIMETMVPYATDAARKELAYTVYSIDESIAYYKALSQNKDVWREQRPRYRVLEDALTPDKTQMEEYVYTLAEELNLPVKVYTSVNGVPQGAARRALEKGMHVKGWYQNGQINIFLPNATGLNDVKATLLHEGVAHYGLRKMVGDKGFNAFLDKVFAEASKEVRNEILRLAPKYKYNLREATEEYLATMAEQGIENPTFWDKVKQLFRKMLEAVGYRWEVTDKDLRYLLWESYNKLGQSNRPTDVAMETRARVKFGIGQFAREEAEETRFRIGRFEDRPAIIQEYDNILKSGRYNFQEAFQDSMLSVKVLQDLIEKQSGKKARIFEDAYSAENRLSSVNKIDNERYIENYFNPLVEEVKKLAGKYGRQEVEDYIYAKSGLERNEVLVRRDAQKKYDEKKKELDAKLESNEINEDQYEALMGQVADEYDKTVTEGADYSGLEGLAFRDYEDELYDQLDEGAITESEFKAKEKEIKSKYKENAQRIVDELEGKASEAEINQLWDRINAATNETLNKLLESGMISAERHKDLMEMMKYYVPLRGWNEDIAEDVYNYTRKEIPVQKEKGAKGRKSLADNPIAQIALSAQSAIILGNRNKMKQRFFNFIINRPNELAVVGNVWYAHTYNTVHDQVERVYPEINETDDAEAIMEKIDTFEKQMEEWQKEGRAYRGKLPLGVELKFKSGQKPEHMVSLMINGKEYVIYINGNPRAAQALNGKTNAEGEENWIFQAYDKLKRLYGGGLTSNNPDFVMANFVRDTLHSGTMEFMNNGFVASAYYMRNIPRSFNTVRRGVLGKYDSSNKYDVYFKEFVKYGGETGYTAIHTIEDYKKEYEKLMNEAKGLRAAARTGQDAFNKLINVLETANRIAEDVNRFNAYMSSREAGKSVEESINAAKNITVNFNKKGALGKNKSVWGGLAYWMNKFILFFNPSVQGLYQVSQTAQKNKKRVMSTLATIMASGFMMPYINELLIMAFGGSDDDDYFNQTEYTRRNNWLIYTPGGYVKIPLPPLFREIYGMGDIFYTLLTNKTTPEKAAVSTMRQLQGAIGFFKLIPEGEPSVESIVEGLAPDIFSPLIDISLNRDFTGRAIAKRNEFNQHMPEYERVYKGVNPIYVEISRIMNEIGGDDARRTPLWGNTINPAYWEHLITSYTGGIGKTISNLSGMIVDLSTGEADNVDVRTIPIVNRFYTPVTDRTVSAAVNRVFYDYQERYESAKFAEKRYKQFIEKGRTEFRKELKQMEENGESKFIDYFGQKMKTLRKMQNELKDDPKNEKLEKEITELKSEMIMQSKKLLE